MSIREYRLEDNADNLRELKGELTSLIPKRAIKKERRAMKEDKTVNLEELSDNFELAIEKHIAAECKKEGILGLEAARIFSSVPNRLKDKAEKLIAWAAEVWISYKNHMDNVKNGFLPIPSVDEVIAKLPKRGK